MSDDEIEREFIRVEERADATRLYVRTIEWPHPHTPATSWVLAAVLEGPPTPAVVDAHQRRVLANKQCFGRCAECRQLKPAGWMHDVAICQGCAERNHGVVH